MRLDIQGRLTDAPSVRAAFIGCGSHAFRNVYPALQFAPVELVATCDLNADKAAAFARQFGAARSYGDHRAMLEKEDVDAVFIVTNYDQRGRPQYVPLAIDCLKAGRHVWMEKPPAAAVEEIEQLRAVAGNRKVMVGFKKMFFPANEKAHELIHGEDFGGVAMAMLQYPQVIPTVEEFDRYRGGEPVGSAIGFLDHLCHPAALLLYLMGMPDTLFYERAGSGAGLATFNFADGCIASIAFTHGAALEGGMERTTIISRRRGHVVVDNNIRVTYHRDAAQRGYGTSPSFYAGATATASVIWEPEFSLGQLYNKGLFMLGYYGEISEFARAILEKRALSKCHLEHALQVTKIFQGFMRGPGRTIRL